MRPNASSGLGDEVADRVCVGDVGGDAEHARAAVRKIADGGVEAPGIAPANRDRAAFVQREIAQWPCQFRARHR